MEQVKAVPILTSELAIEILLAVIRRAKEARVAVAVALHNRQKQELAFCCMDGATLANSAMARNKSAQSVHTGKRTSETIRQVRAGELTPQVIGIEPENLVPYAGGVPIYTKEGILIGGIGISGLAQEDDEFLGVTYVAKCSNGELLTEKPPLAAVLA